MASSKETYCLCGQPYNVGQFMIECDCCREWFHGSCVNVKVYQSDDIDKYHCPKCAQTYGPSVLKIPTNNHRADRYELGAEARAPQVGTPAWVRSLAARPLRPTPTSLQRMRPDQFTEEFVRDNGFTRPVLFSTTEGLEMKLPNPANFTVRSVLRYCTAPLEVEVIDVRKQSTLRMPLGDFVEYFETPPEGRGDRVLNVISLEFSDTSMSPLVEPPLLARRLDWATTAWRGPPPKPSIRKYCLLSAAGAYTDWHVDFGGTTVWYHVLHGRKIFYLVPPTSTNLALYQQWSASNNQNERFFGDMVEWYGTLELVAGQTLVIPGGWLHAVLSPKDSLVFGGNLLHSYAIEMQLQIYEIERRVETPPRYKYPLFEHMHWFAGAQLLALLRRHNEETQDEDFTLHEGVVSAETPTLAPLLLRGVRLLTNALKEWHALKSSDTNKRDNVPKCLNSGQLVRELCKELRTLEKRAAAHSHTQKDYKPRNASPKKSQKTQQNQKKSLKLTLPKPIMHMAQNGVEYEDKVYADKYFLDNKEVYPDNRFLQDVKYGNGLPQAKFVDNKDMVLPEQASYQNFEEVPYDGSEYVERHDKKNVLRIKLNPPQSEPTRQPPPYSAGEHSILKSHLTRLERPRQHWTISKKDIGDYHDDQILFTNDNVVGNVGQDLPYGPGMYCAEESAPEFGYEKQYHEFPYAPAHSAPAYAGYRYEVHPPDVPVGASYQENYAALPSYDTAVAQHLSTAPQHPQLAHPQPHPAHAHDTQQPPVTQPVAFEPPVRRSERPARRRVSPTYDYEDGDLYIDDAPAPRRKRTKPAYKAQGSSGAAPYRRPAPANGIESLIQASELAEGEPEPTSEAVAGMLSIGAPAQPFGLPVTPPATHSSSGRRKRSVVLEEPPEEEPEDDVIREVHRDEEYVYPSLEMSSDEEEEWGARRRRPRARVDHRHADKDESWSPRARLGRLVPRLRTPARHAVRRESVRAALSAAAARAHHAHTAHHQPPGQTAAVQDAKDTMNAKRAVLASKSRRPPPAPAPSPAASKNSRLKKGMKTAKQRLGKILKIHKMIY